MNYHKAGYVVGASLAEEALRIQLAEFSENLELRRRAEATLQQERIKAIQHVIDTGEPYQPLITKQKARA